MEPLFDQILSAKGSRKIILLLEILECIAGSKNIKTICHEDLEFRFNATDNERMDNIYQYVMKNFARDLPLKEIAGVACLAPNAFCRYFKSRVKKSFSKFLIEVRIGHACSMLAETNEPIIDICYSCGYNNFSNFYRHFKSVTGKPPLQHRKNYQDDKAISA